MRATCSMFIILLTAPLVAAAELPGFTRSSPFDEQVRWTTFDSGIRLYVNAPASIDAAKPTLLVLYATPNGSTIEQTLGAAKAPGVDYRFDIQHVAAQIRRLREVNARENVVLAVTEALKLSWPAFRQSNPDAGKIIRSVVDLAARDLPGDGVRIVLSGHSGGGSFMFGFLNAQDAIPDRVARIVFLDANYAYDDVQRHGDKLLAWLRGDASRRLIVIAYDDREITLDGKKVVGPQGGTFRATRRMLARAKTEVDVAESTQGPFTTYAAMRSQMRCFVHPNPGNKILHTALVGEMNGLLHALTLDTPEEGKWGQFGGPRAYEKWIAPLPTTHPATTRATTTTTPAAASPDHPPIPPRPVGAPTGSTFAKQIESLPPPEREAAILRELTRGNVPDFLRRFVPIHVRAKSPDGAQHVATYFVSPDYLAVGSDGDFLRVPMTPATAQAVADALGCRMVTRKIVDDVYQAAEVKPAPRPMTDARESVSTFVEHQRLIEQQRKALGKSPGALIAGIKKDVVVSNRLRERPNRVAIYGWHRPDGAPIQPLTIVHAATYVDYSHGVRLMSRNVIVDGRRADAADVMKDAALHGLLSDEGVVDIGSYAPEPH